MGSAFANSQGTSCFSCRHLYGSSINGGSWRAHSNCHSAGRLVVDSFNFSAGTRAIEMSSSSSSSDMKIEVLSSIEANFPWKMMKLVIAHRGLPSFIQSPELKGLEKNAQLSVLLEN